MTAFTQERTNLAVRRIAVGPSAVAVLLLCASALVSSHARAAEGAADAPAVEQQESPFKAGPLTGSLGSIATIDVPEGYQFVEKAQMSLFNRLTGNLESPSDIGALIAPDDWVVFFSWDAVGYVKDDDKDDLDADELMEAFKESEEPSNEARAEQGMTKLFIDGWQTAPFYDASTNNLTWALRNRMEDGSKNINHQVRVLGRRGALSIILAASPEGIEDAVVKLGSLVGTLKFKQGETYAEYTEGDKVAEYGLTGLVLGGGALLAAKAGLFGKLGKFLKFIVIGGIAVVGGIWSKIKSRFNGES